MSTKLSDLGDLVVVETVASFGGKRKMARGAVHMPKNDAAAIREEIIRQAEALRKLKGIDQAEPGPVA